MKPAWRFFPVTVGGVRRISPSFIRVTFVGSCLATFADNGYDQRLKLVLPLPGLGFASMPTGTDWYSQWRALPLSSRNPIRTYTAAAVRPGVGEVDVDMVVHGDGGPASRWALSAAVGDPLVLMGPNAEHAGDHGGLEFRLPLGVRRVLIAGDETAVPAVTAIVARLPRSVTGSVVLEVPFAGDRAPLSTPDGVRVTWLSREGDHDYGRRLVAAVREVAAALPVPVPVGAPDLESVDPDDIWEVPSPEEAGGDCYAWLAGESSSIVTLRRHLVKHLGWDRRAVAFMGYWRKGHAES